MGAMSGPVADGADVIAVMPFGVTSGDSSLIRLGRAFATHHHEAAGRAKCASTVRGFGTAANNALPHYNAPHQVTSTDEILPLAGRSQRLRRRELQG